MISLIVPSRNNLKYLQWSYNSIRKNAPLNVEICVADDFSNDGTWEWCQEIMKTDNYFKAIRNDGPTRLGHTILYDRLINEVATNDICGIWHADMYMTPGTVESIVDNVTDKVIISLTRIEPPLHPPGVEKVTMDFGTEPEYFDEAKFLDWYSKYKMTIGDKTTDGIFAPWFFMKKDFQEINGHDPLYAPQSKEDSDIFNRFALNNVAFKQLWNAAVYHMTCRGSRYNPTLTTPGTNSKEWEEQNIRSSRNFIRKWGHFVKHNELLVPIIPHKYHITFILFGLDYVLDISHLLVLEPWCSTICVPTTEALLPLVTSYKKSYIENEQPNTTFDLNQKIFIGTPVNGDIKVTFDPRRLTNNSMYIIHNLSDIITESGSIGEFELDIFKISIKDLKTYERDLIVCKK